MTRKIVLMVSIIVILAIAYFALTYKGPATFSNTHVATSTVATTTEKVITESTATYDLDVKYPQFGIQIIDAQIAKQANDAVAAFHKDASGQTPEAGMPKFGFSGEYKTVYKGDDIISVRMDMYQNLGGAHGFPFVIPLNFDVKSGRALTLDDALRMTGLTLQQLADQSLAKLQKEFGDSVFTEGIVAKPENYQTFVIDKNTVTFIYQAYQAVAYAAGMPEVSFPRKQ